ncbi:MAG: tandem-95 repeat protein [Verrucomicrobiales bacterium]|nr:tandem-95 repeat protein [Verrucomicrobiales bacterium]
MPATTWSANVQLAWDSNPESNLQTYRLYRGTASGKYDAGTNVGLQTLADVSGLADGQTYFFAVSAINQSGLESPRSIEVAYQVPTNLPPVVTNDTFTGTEDYPLNFALDFADPEGKPIAVSIAVGPQHGTLSGSDLNWTFTPNPNWNGNETLTFQASDGINTSLAFVTLSLAPQNDAPVCIPPVGVSGDEDASITAVLGAADVDNDDLFIRIESQPANATVSLSNPFVATITPKPNFNGSDSFVYSVSDGTVIRTASVPFTVRPVNDAPTANPNTATVKEGESVPITLSGSDPENDPLTFPILANPSGGTITGTSPNLIFTASANSAGNVELKFAANDGKLSSAPATVAITILPGNVKPTASSQSIELPEDGSIAFTLGASDPEVKPLAYLVGTPQHGTLTGTVPNLTYRPEANYNGTDSFSFSVNDGELTSDTATISINVISVNDAPKAIASSVSVIEGQSVNITLAASDIENDALTFSIATSPILGTLSGTPPNLVYTAKTGSSGSDSLRFTASDKSLASTPETISITVIPRNTRPTANPQPVILAEDGSIAINLVASDLENDALTYTTTAPLHGSLSGIAPNLTYKPVTNYNGTDTFSFIANDGEYDSDSATVTITVTSVNDAPKAIAGSYSVSAGKSVNITLAATDVENDAVSFAITGSPTLGTLSGTAPNLVYTAKAGSSGSDSIRFTASDKSLTSAPETITITVLAGNTKPVASSQSVVLDEDNSIAITLVASDLESPTLTYTVTPPSRGTLTGTAPNLVYKPAVNFNGTDAFTFKASDGSLVSDIATVSITVSAVNDAPTVVSSTITLSEDTSVPLVLMASDIDSSTLTYTITKKPTKGTISGEAPSLTYTPNANYSGSDSIQFTVNDGSLTSTNTATITFKISAANDKPTATPRSIALAEDSSLAFTLTGTDPEKDALFYQIKTQPLYGRVTGTPPNIRYTPNTNFFGSDSFEFTVADRSLTSDPAVVSVSVTPVNDAPCADNTSVSTTKATAVALPFSCKDVDGDALTMKVTKLPTGGTLSGTAPNLVYTPSATFLGTDTVDFTVSDGKLTSTTGRITISVVEGSTTTSTSDKITGDLSGASDDALVTYGGTATRLITGAASVLANDTASDGSALTASLGKAPANGTVTIQSDGTFTYTHLGGTALTDEFTYVATSMTGGTTETRVVIHLVRILDGVVTADGTEIEISVAKGITYQLDVQDLIPGTPATWQNLTSFTGETDGIATLTDTTPVGSSDRLYRVRCTGAFGEITTESWLRPAADTAE